jgi:hypothetical protein
MAHKYTIASEYTAAFAAAVLATGLFASGAHAGPDDDAPFRSDGKTRNASDPIYFGGKLADFLMNAEVDTGLRVLPPTGTELFAGQRFDLRIETQIPAQAAPKLLRLSVNGRDMTEAFRRRIAKQGSGPESGTPQSDLLYGATARNLSFDKAGRYELEAVVAVDGSERRIVNRYDVAAAPKPNAPGAARKVVFFLGDGTGLPLRTAARIVSKGAFEGRVRDTLAMEKMPVGLYLALLLTLYGVPACAAELVGRVLDTMDAKVFAGAVVQVRNIGQDPRSATTDRHGFFRMPGLTPGAHILDVNLPDGRDFVARLVLLPGRKTQFLELDYSRIVPPEDDEQY